MNSRLKITTVEDRKEDTSVSTTQSRRIEVQGRYERLWLNDPEQFNPENDQVESLRIERTKEVLNRLPQIQTGIDLGAGYGVLTRYLAQKGVKMTAVDVAQNALKRLEDLPNVTTIRQYIPSVHIHDHKFDLVLSTDLIAHLKSDEYRLYIAELVGLCKPDGYIVCSTPLDIHSDDALPLFARLVETEMIIDEWVFSYHRLYLRTIELLTKVKLKPIAALLKKSRLFLNWCEKISRFIWQENGISHAIFCGKVKPIIPSPQKQQQPIERKEKRFVWE